MLSRASCIIVLQKETVVETIRGFALLRARRGRLKRVVDSRGSRLGGTQMAENLTGDEQELLDKVPVDGSSIGNKSLRKELGWADDKYWAVRDALINKNIL